MSFINKVVLVTGASSGIGEAIAKGFAKEGANVVLVGRNEDNLLKVAKISGQKTFVIKADVSKDNEAVMVVKKTIEKYGKIDILVNNAGIVRKGSICDGQLLAAYDEVMNTNLRAVFHLTSLAAPHLIKAKGNIVNISSVAALSTPPVPEFIPYYVSKAALDHFMRGAALELGSFGVRVNNVNPGPVKTDILTNGGFETEDQWSWDNIASRILLGRVGEPEEIADLVLFLASDKSKSITGSVFLTDNGALLKF